MGIIRKYNQVRLYLSRKKKVYRWRIFFFRKALDNYWKLRFGILSLLLVSFLAYLLFWRGDNPTFKLRDTDTWKNLGSELHGLIFDIILFGIVLVIFEKVREKKDQVIKYLEELDDFRGWDSGEAYQRNHGILRRLINESYYRIDMTDVFLKSQNVIKPLNFEFSQFRRTCLDGSTIYNAYILSAFFGDATFRSTKFEMSRFDNCTFSTPYFLSTHFWECDFINTSFQGLGITDLSTPTVFFDHVRFTNCDFKYFNVYSITDFHQCEFQNCEAYGYQKERLELLGASNGITYIPSPANHQERDGNEKSILT